MTSFNAPFIGSIDSVAEVLDLVQFPDPLWIPPPPGWMHPPPGMTAAGPGVSRFAGSRVRLLKASGTFHIISPVRGSARVVTVLGSSIPPGTQFVEIAPLPFFILRATLANLKLTRDNGSYYPGMPTFYLGAAILTLPGPVEVNPPVDQVVETASPTGDSATRLATNVNDAFFGVLFQDRVPLAPETWLALLRDALAAGHEDVSGWNTLLGKYTTNKSVRVGDHRGLPLEGQQHFSISFTSGRVPFEITLQADADDLEAAAVVQAGRSLFEAGDQAIVTWRPSAPSPPPDDTALPVQSLYEGNTANSSSAPVGEPTTAQPGSIHLPPGSTHYHLQVLDLSRWLSAPPNVAVPRYRLDSRVEPIVDGIPTFARLYDDILACKGNQLGMQFAGWVMKSGFPLISGDDTTTLANLTNAVLAAKGDARFLITRFVNWKNNPGPELAQISPILFAVLFGYLFYGALTKDDAKGIGLIGVGLVAALGAGFELAGEKNTLDTITGLYESNNVDKQKLNTQGKQGVALWSVYPVRLVDNPVPPHRFTIAPGLYLDDYLDRWGVWHQKIQVFHRTPDADGNEYVGYLGGIDFNTDRYDAPGHQRRAYQDPVNRKMTPPGVNPFHDVHARVTGPACLDLITTFNERWDFDYSQRDVVDPEDPELVGGPSAPAITPPSTLSLTKNPRHIVQVGRTNYVPRPGTGTPPLPFSPSGESTCAQTLIKAISAAREYIYIEDQYFVPNKEYLQALVDAAQHCARLIVVVSDESDQYLGSLRRSFVIGQLLSASAWGTRMQIGAPQRRPYLPDPGRLTYEGRCRLMAKLNEGDNTVSLGPKARVPAKTPFWLWVEGELMLATRFMPSVSSPISERAIEVEVVRCPDPHGPCWGAKRHSHPENAPVTMSQLKGIYVHAKVMMVDDVFVAIGSPNINRRGLYHDGEIAAYTIPQQLRNAPDNPARQLRTTLWAEQLGLVPEMGPALLHDPIAAFELFRSVPLTPTDVARRTFYDGNRFTPLDRLATPYLDVSISTSWLLQIKNVLSAEYLDALKPDLWNALSDPTLISDPTPEMES